MMDEVIGEWRVQNRRGVELLPGDGGSYDGKNARADNGSNAQRGQRPRAKRFLKPMFWLLRFGDQLVNRFAREELVRQGNAPGSAELGSLNSNRNSRTGQAEEFATETRIARRTN